MVRASAKGSAAARRRSCCESVGNIWRSRLKCSSSSLGRAGLDRRIKPVAISAGLIARADSTRTRGLPSDSSTILCSARGSTGPGARDVISCRASSFARPLTPIRGIPSKPCGSRPDRTANTIATASSSSRRATKPRTCAEFASSHCASSITHRRGATADASDSKVNVARPIKNMSGMVPARIPNVISSASCWGRGKTDREPRRGRQSWCNAEYESSTSACIPVTVRICAPSALSTRYSSRTVFPTPAPPTRTAVALRPARMRRKRSSSRVRSKCLSSTLSGYCPRRMHARRHRGGHGRATESSD